MKGKLTRVFIDGKELDGASNFEVKLDSWGEPEVYIESRKLDCVKLLKKKLAIFKKAVKMQEQQVVKLVSAGK